MGKKLKNWIKKAVLFLLNPRLLLCLAVGWMITNGWSYVIFGLGTYFQNPWMMAIGGGYLTFLWLPISPEKIVTVAIAIGLLRWWFPKDEKTLGVLLEMKEKIKSAVKKRKKKKEEENIPPL